MARKPPTLEKLLAAAEGHERHVCRSVHPPRKIIIYNDPQFAEAKAAELGAEVRHALMRQPNSSATISVVLADDQSIPY